MLVLIRGLPGSGKTTQAKVLETIGFKHFEADMYMVQPFNPDLLSKAHELCFENAEFFLNSGHAVVVSNTFTRKWEMEPYMKWNPKIITAKGEYGSIHNVPLGTLVAMRLRWED